jgi:hypothetical protein
MGNEYRSQIATLCDRIDSHVPHDAALIAPAILMIGWGKPVNFSLIA